MKHLDLFSGIGGFALAVRNVWRDEYENIGHSEVEKFPCKVYHKHFPESECLGDITKIKWQEGQADIITGGFPCQPFSVAGKQRGKEDDRHLWPEMLRAIREVRPSWIVGENVAGIINLALDEVLSSLESENYSTETFIIPACAINAPHRRDRVWIVAYPKNNRSRGIAREICEADGRQIEQMHIGTEDADRDASQNSVNGRNRGRDNGNKRGSERTLQAEGLDSNDSNAQKQRGQRWNSGKFGKSTQQEEGLFGWNAWRESWLEVATRLCRVDDGVRNRVDRLKSLGNAIVPQVAEQIFKAIKEIES